LHSLSYWQYKNFPVIWGKKTRVFDFLEKIFFRENSRECSRVFFQVPPTGPGLQRQPSVGNVLARASSFSTTGGPLLPRQISAVSDHHEASMTTIQLQRQTSAGSPISPKQNDGSLVQRQNSGGSSSSTNTNTGNGVLRQGSQGSLFEQIASQAKDLVRETTRQSSQDGLLAHMDKVLTSVIMMIYPGTIVFICIHFLEICQTDDCVIYFFLDVIYLLIYSLSSWSIRRKKKLRRQARIVYSRRWNKYVFL